MPISYGDTDNPTKAAMLRPHWIKSNMTIEDAARRAYFRGYTLKSEWHPLFGLRIIAVPISREVKK
jgi:hypothetical protein